MKLTVNTKDICTVLCQGHTSNDRAGKIFRQYKEKLLKQGYFDKGTRVLPLTWFLSEYQKDRFLSDTEVEYLRQEFLKLPTRD